MSSVRCRPIGVSEGMEPKKGVCCCISEPPASTVKSDLWRLKAEDYNWDPVAWSDYPKQPMWTVPLPKMPPPVIIRYNEEPPRPHCQFPPTEVVSADKCPPWRPDMPNQMLSTWNPFINEDNVPYSTLVGPRTRTKTASKR